MTARRSERELADYIQSVPVSVSLLSGDTLSAQHSDRLLDYAFSVPGVYSQTAGGPGGNLLFVNHFAAEKGPRWWIERAMAPASRALGWHPDFAIQALLSAEDLARASIAPVPPLGVFTLVRLPN